jgi:hypothetical protein
MFVPDPGSEFFLSQIPDPESSVKKIPGFRIRIRNTDLHQAKRHGALFLTCIPSFLASLSTSFFLVSFGNLTEGKLTYNGYHYLAGGTLA